MFATLVTHVYKTLEQVKLEKIHKFLNESSVSLKEHVPFLQQLFRKESLSDIIIHLRHSHAWNSLNFLFLESLTEWFGDNYLQTKMIVYKEQVRSFKQNTKLTDYLRVHMQESASVTIEPDYKPLIIKLNKQDHGYSLADIEELERQLTIEFQLSRWIVRFSNASPKDMAFFWLIPKSAAQLIEKYIRENHPNFRKMKIQWMVVNESTCKVLLH